MPPEQQQQLLTHWLRNDAGALNLAHMLIHISQSWDDLIDGDKPVSSDSINAMMRYALIDIPKNPFYQQHIASLHPIMEDRLYTWLDANTLETSNNTSDLRVSYIIRSVITDIVIHMTYLIGGFDWRQQAAVSIRQAVYRDNESFMEYQKEMRHVHE